MQALFLLQTHSSLSINASEHLSSQLLTKLPNYTFYRFVILFVPQSFMLCVNLRKLTLSARKERLALTFLFPLAEIA